jgi:AcrR family transcriptional regulator
VTERVVTQEGALTERRAPLTRERVLRAAVDVADRGGLEALSMRKLGQELGVDAMALYRHVRDKDDLLDGVVEVVVGEIERPEPGGPWKTVLRQHAMAARGVMLRHPWAPRVLEERGTAGPAALAHINAVLGTLLGGGFSMELSHHALHSLSSRIFGFHQDLFDDSGRGPTDPEAEARVVAMLAVSYPSLAELAKAASHEGGLGACDDDVEFAFGLDLILDGLERLRAAN